MKDKLKRIFKCECCNAELKTITSTQKYCSQCSLHNKILLHKIGNLKYRLNNIRRINDGLRFKLKMLKDTNTTISTGDVLHDKN
jgi:hypothetical protein